MMDLKLSSFIKGESPDQDRIVSISCSPKNLRDAVSYFEDFLISSGFSINPGTIIVQETERSKG